MYFQISALAVLLVLSFYSDIKKSTIPNKYVVPGAILGLLYHSITAGVSGVIFSAQGLAVGFGLLFLLYLFGALGAGDVKLFAAIGAITGTAYVITLTIYSVLFACLIGILLILVKGELTRRLKNLYFSLINLLLVRNRKILQDYKQYSSFRFPFMYAVMPAAMISCLYPISF